MQRVTITIDEALLAEVDLLVAARGYQGRSEAIRDLARAGIQQALLDADNAQDCIAALVYVFDHGARELARRLAKLFHDHHDLSVATTHVHLNHESGMEVAILKGATRQVRQLANAVLAERGVRHGKIIIVPASLNQDEHSHVGGQHGHSHTHIRTR
jgi:CopG family nickel-responsive transcriptional regulator